MSEDNQLAPINQSILYDSGFDRFEQTLEGYGLPFDNVIASRAERIKILQALPDFLNNMSHELKIDARYLSKFIAGSVVGLFDASLNFIWDEVVLNLRKKVVSYGLDCFYDAAIGGTHRDQFTNENDLPSVKDQVLLDTCKKLELIPDLLYRKLCHILDMRNQIGASHPNDYSISAYELLGWLQICIKGVLMEKISESALTVKSIIDNVKKTQMSLDGTNLTLFRQSIKTLSPDMVSNLLISLFGVFVSPTFAEKKIQCENIMELSKIAWDFSTEKVKYSLGEKIDSFRANLDEYKTKRSELFFKICNGERYYSSDARTIKLTLLCEQLETVHNGWDNYANETPVAREIMSFVSSTADIPDIRFETVLKVFLVCRIGKDCGYCGGVSPGARPYYDKLFKMLDQKSVLLVLDILSRNENGNLLSGTYRPRQVKAICENMKSKILTDRCIAMLDYIIGFKEENFGAVFNTKEFKEFKNGLF